MLKVLVYRNDKYFSETSIFDKTYKFNFVNN